MKKNMIFLLQCGSNDKLVVASLILILVLLPLSGN